MGRSVRGQSLLRPRGSCRDLIAAHLDNASHLIAGLDPESHDIQWRKTAIGTRMSTNGLSASGVQTSKSLAV
jgi:hypothetical protein